MAKFNGSVSNIEDNRNKVSAIDENSTDIQYPSAKAVKDYVDENAGGDLSNYLKKDGTDSMTGDLDMGGHNVTAIRDIFMPDIYGSDPPEYRRSEYVGKIGFNDRRYLMVQDKVTSISSSSTDNQLPSAKCVYDAIQAALYVDTSEVIIAAEV